MCIVRQSDCVLFEYVGLSQRSESKVHAVEDPVSNARAIEHLTLTMTLAVMATLLTPTVEASCISEISVQLQT